MHSSPPKHSPDILLRAVSPSQKAQREAYTKEHRDSVMSHYDGPKGGHEQADSPSRRDSLKFDLKAQENEELEGGPRSCSRKVRDFLHYETVQIVRIRNVRVSLLHRFFQLGILAYIIIYGLIIRKGYQKTDLAAGSSSTKLRGMAYTNGSIPWSSSPQDQLFQVYDVFDLQSPALEDDAAFLTTNMWTTPQQTRGKCVWRDGKNACDSAHPCVPLTMVNNGRQIGNCVPVGNGTREEQKEEMRRWKLEDESDERILPDEAASGAGFCELFAWCPAEQEPKSSAFALQGLDLFTLFTRIEIHYPNLHQKASNEGDSDSVTPGLNSWTFGEIAQLAGYQWSDLNQTGALIAMQTVFDCAFDATSPACTPDISFVRLDNPKSTLSKGYNFRTVLFNHDHIGSRDLTKRYGIRLLILMSGVGAQADLVATLTSIGAGIGLLSVASLIADMVSTKILHNRKLYAQAKYKEISIEDPDIDLDPLNLKRVFSKRSRAGSTADRDGDEKEQPLISVNNAG
jgi:hypothetical protein